MSLSRHAHCNVRHGARLNAWLDMRHWALHSAHFVLLWFALSIGVAIASPLLSY